MILTLGLINSQEYVTASVEDSFFKDVIQIRFREEDKTVTAVLSLQKDELDTFIAALQAARKDLDNA